MTVENIVAALAETNGLVSLAARRLGCSPQNIYSRARKSPAIREAIASAREELVDLAELALRAAVMERQPWAVALVLKTLGRDRGYSERQEVAVTSAEAAIVLRVVEVRDDSDADSG